MTLGRTSARMGEIFDIVLLCVSAARHYGHFTNGNSPLQQNLVSPLELHSRVISELAQCDDVNRKKSVTSEISNSYSNPRIEPLL